jgi:hypothetical protein
MMFSLACRCSSLTHDFALSRDDCLKALAYSVCGVSARPYRLSDVVDHYSAVRIAIVHGREGLVSLLPCGIPDLELDRRVVIEGDSLSEESSSDGRLSVVIELVLNHLVLCYVNQGSPFCTLTNRKTNELC